MATKWQMRSESWDDPAQRAGSHFGDVKELNTGPDDKDKARVVRLFKRRALNDRRVGLNVSGEPREFCERRTQTGRSATVSILGVIPFSIR